MPPEETQQQNDQSHELKTGVKERDALFVRSFPLSRIQKNRNLKPMPFFIVQMDKFPIL